MDFKRIRKAVVKIRTEYTADVYLISASIYPKTADRLFAEAESIEDKKPNAVLILTTNGGDPDSGYRIMRYLQDKYDNVIVMVFGVCKSTGTLMALGANAIVMSVFGELGPIDVQLSKEDELFSTSGLAYIQSLIVLDQQLFNSFSGTFTGLKQKGAGFPIATMTAAEIASKLATGLISPISAQIDPLKLGEVQRAIQIAEKYGERLCKKAGFTTTDHIGKLISDYPSHGFVIDYDEAKELFPVVEKADDDELELASAIGPLVRKQSGGAGVVVAMSEPIEDDDDDDDSKESEAPGTSSTDNELDNAGNGAQKTGQGTTATNDSRQTAEEVSSAAGTNKSEHDVTEEDASSGTDQSDDA